LSPPGLQVARNIKERAKDGGFFPLLIFPEGTTTVNHVILQFKVHKTAH
jgi:1-acyl-sn-glycerol-3-phosphate acyltransferase